jgi:uncharacterized protein (DUF111 family)
MANDLKADIFISVHFNSSIDSLHNGFEVFYLDNHDNKAIEKLEAIIFRETSSLGVRRWPASRRILSRRSHTVSTEHGQVEGVLAESPTGEISFAPEFESCKLLAEKAKQSLRAVYDAARQAFASEQQGKK